MEIGEMKMPDNFKYRKVYEKGRPLHQEFDSFSLRHPPMDRVRRAKIFSPFAALRGFSEALSAKDIQYVERPVPGEEEKEHFDRILRRLNELTRNGRAARENSVGVTATYFVLCRDRDSSAYMTRGRLETVSGICRRVDGTISRSITVGQKVISFDDLVSIEINDDPEEVSDE